MHGMSFRIVTVTGVGIAVVVLAVFNNISKWTWESASYLTSSKIKSHPLVEVPVAANESIAGRETSGKNNFEETIPSVQLRKEKQENVTASAAAAAAGTNRTHQANITAVAGNDQRQGFIVLGMHRSGTSMLSGLLHTACGYTVGGPLIKTTSYNAKGFFERVDVVVQNDNFMKAQGVRTGANIIYYDWNQALKDKESGKTDFENHGKSGLAFFNNRSNAPWMQKDPRMCITLKTWLKLIDNEPAIVFTFRHPLEVAMSLKRRDKMTLEQGLRLWIIYNMRAVQNSQGLCIVRSSNEAVLTDPINEIQRISDELTSKCNLPEPPFQIKQEVVDEFVDPSLQHNRNNRTEEATDKEVIATYNDGKCVVHTYKSEDPEGLPAHNGETLLYGWAMRIYCDLQSGKAYGEYYEWPNVMMAE